MHYKWVTLLAQYTIEVRFIPGIENKVSDYLSRYINPEQLKNAPTGSINMSEYNKHKRFRFYNKKKKNQPKQKYNQKIKWNTPKDDYQRKVYWANLKDNKYWNKKYQKSWYHQEFQKSIPDEITANSTHTQYMIIQRRKERQHHCQKANEIRRSSRLKDKERKNMRWDNLVRGGITYSEVL